MEPWLIKAIEYFPELKKYYVNLNNPSQAYLEDAFELWIDLEGWFYKSVEEGDAEFQKRVIAFLNYCMSGTLGDSSSQIQQAIFCGFLPSIGMRESVWQSIPTWFTDNEFQKYKSEICYLLDENKKLQLLEIYDKFKA